MVTMTPIGDVVVAVEAIDLEAVITTMIDMEVTTVIDMVVVEEEIDTVTMIE